MWTPRQTEKAPTVEGLRPIVQSRLKEIFLTCSTKAKSIGINYTVMIVDDNAMRILSSAVGMYDLNNCAGVTHVELLKKSRAPYRQAAPIYFISPSKESITQLISDWTPSKKRRQSLYADGIFLYFTSSLSDDLFNMIKACKPLVKRLKALTEVNLDFIANEMRAFHLDMDSSFSQLYKPNSSSKLTENIIAEKLVSVCASLNEYPHIRYKVSSKLCASIANIFHQKFTEFVGKDKNWWYHGDSEHMDRGRSTLLLLSRSDDCLSPLMHEFTYQAMVHDLLQVKDDKITYKVQSSETGDNIDKDALLNDNDKVWVELRGKHIADVIQILSMRIREIVNSSTGVSLNTKGNNAKALSLAQMSNALKALPEYRDVMEKLSQHMHIAHACMDIFTRHNLLEMSDLEQTLATGKMDTGKVPKLSELLTTVEETLRVTPDSLTRFRLLAIFIVGQQGLRESDRSRLLDAANLSQNHTAALVNLGLMGIPLVQQKTGVIASVLGPRKQSFKAESDSEYSSSRFVCDLKVIIQELQDRTLSLDEYPSVLPMPEEPSTQSFGVAGSVRSSRAPGSVRGETGSKFSRNRQSSVDKVKIGGARQIVFMLGGACYSELRSAQELMDKGGPETIVGCTRFINSSEFVDDLASL